jgi:hypothetical protein
MPEDVDHSFAYHRFSWFLMKIDTEQFYLLSISCPSSRNTKKHRRDLSEVFVCCFIQDN